MKFGLFYLGHLPKPLDNDDWDEGQQVKRFHEILDQVELADRLGFDYVWIGEHHFLGEYTQVSAPEVIMGAISQRTKQIRIGSGITQMVTRHNHPARVAERAATIDVLSHAGGTSSARGPVIRTSILRSSMAWTARPTSSSRSVTTCGASARASVSAC